MRNSRYLTLSGILGPEGLKMEPCYLVEHRPREVPMAEQTPFGSTPVQFKDGTPVDETQLWRSVQVVLTDDGGRTVWRDSLPLTQLCLPGASEDLAMVAGSVPFPDVARGLQLLLENQVVFELASGEQEPAVTLDLAGAAQAEFRGYQTVNWDASHPEGRELFATVCYSTDDGASWRALTPSLRESKAAIDFDALPGGKRCRLSVLVSDGMRTVRAVSDRLAVPEKPCLVRIVSPFDGTTIDGREVWLEGDAWYLEDGREEEAFLAWTSSLDGHLGNDRLVRVANLSPGKHEITLRAGPKERAGQATIRVEVVGEELPG